MVWWQSNLRAPPHERVTIAEKNWLSYMNVAKTVDKNDSRCFLEKLKYMKYGNLADMKKGNLFSQACARLRGGRRCIRAVSREAGLL